MWRCIFYRDCLTLDYLEPALVLDYLDYLALGVKAGTGGPYFKKFHSSDLLILLFFGWNFSPETLSLISSSVDWSNLLALEFLRCWFHSIYYSLTWVYAFFLLINPIIHLNFSICSVSLWCIFWYIFTYSFNLSCSMFLSRAFSSNSLYFDSRSRYLCCSWSISFWECSTSILWVGEMCMHLLWGLLCYYRGFDFGLIESRYSLKWSTFWDV